MTMTLQNLQNMSRGQCMLLRCVESETLLPFEQGCLGSWVLLLHHLLSTVDPPPPLCLSRPVWFQPGWEEMHLP